MKDSAQIVSSMAAAPSNLLSAILMTLLQYGLYETGMDRDVILRAEFASSIRYGIPRPPKQFSTAVPLSAFIFVRKPSCS